MRLPSYLLPALLGFLTLDGPLSAQEEAENEQVQYVLILPEEKAPDLVKPEENNPFESISDGNKDENSTEENLVRDILLRMQIGGAASGMNGMRVMLGGMRLEAGMEVPPVIPDQQVKLRVKAITATSIELVWVEKKPTGLPPKLLVIPMDGSPSVRYRMGGGTGGSSMGTVRRPDVSAFSPSRQLEAEQDQPQTRPQPPQDIPQKPAIVKNGKPVTLPPEKPEAEKASPAQPAPPPPPGAPEASVLRMLFGNRPSEPK